MPELREGIGLQLDDSAGNAAGAGKSETFCASCRLNQTIPDLSREQNHALWNRMENAKRRLVYSLLSFKLPVANKTDDPKQGLAFAFLEDQVKPDGTVSRVMTGHDNGLITLNIAEADDSVREKIRLAMGEPLRTLLGHFRHEIGHYYWDRLIRGTKFVEQYRALFGNEEAELCGSAQEVLREWSSGELAGKFHQRLRDRASLGRLGGKLGPLHAHPGCFGGRQ